jgi:hypothetical protein
VPRGDAQVSKSNEIDNISSLNPWLGQISPFSIFRVYFYQILHIPGEGDRVVVKTLFYKPEGCGFETG